MRLYLIRHGQSEGNASGIVQGRLDYGLTELGHVQARHTAGYLRTIRAARLVASPLARARQTAEAIAAVLDLEVESDPALAEYDMGEAAGLTGPQIRERFPHVEEVVARGERPTFPGEEGRGAFRARVDSFLERARADGRDTIAVGHGGVVNLACHIVLGLEYGRGGVFRASNCSITELVEDRTGRLVLLRQNDTCHLDGIETVRDLG